MDDCHITCIVCDGDGCTGCPNHVNGFCELPLLVQHEREHMHADCVAAFDRHTENRCDGTTCNCPAAPELVADAEETTPLPEPAEPMRLVVFGRRFAAVASLALALFSGACATTRPAVEVEAVGTLAPSYHSIAVAPVHHDEPPTLGQIAGSADDDAGEVASTTVRTADAGESDAAPEVTAKGAGLTLGGAR